MLRGKIARSAEESPGHSRKPLIWSLRAGWSHQQAEIGMVEWNEKSTEISAG
jgi:hypothetical protein